MFLHGITLHEITLYGITYSPVKPPIQPQQPRLLRAADAAIVKTSGPFVWTLSHLEVPKERSYGIGLLDGAMKPMRAYCSVSRESNNARLHVLDIATDANKHSPLRRTLSKEACVPWRDVTNLGDDTGRQEVSLQSESFNKIHWPIGNLRAWSTLLSLL